MVSYTKRCEWGEVTIRLYTLTEYVDELGGTFRGLAEFDGADRYADHLDGHIDWEEVEAPGASPRTSPS